MRIHKLVVILALALPAVAFGQITGSKHDLNSAASNMAATRTAPAVAAAEICIYCHTPHNAEATRGLWNKAVSAATAGWTAGATTTAGTPLPLNINVAGTPSARCMACHDGTVAVGDVLNLNGAAGNINTGKVGTAPSTATYLLNSAGLQKSHPVAVPYAGATYNLVASKAPTAQYQTVVAAGCVGSVLCANNANVPLYGATAATAGIECGSCHEPHRPAGTTNMLRIANTGSALCLACHIK